MSLGSTHSPPTFSGTLKSASRRSGGKRFEIRRNDREFAVGDILVLREFEPETDTFTGQVEERQITFLLSDDSIYITGQVISVDGGIGTSFL